MLKHADCTDSHIRSIIVFKMSGAFVMDAIEKKIADVFVTFTSEEDPRILYAALNDIEDVQRTAPQEDRDSCRRGLSLLLIFLATLDTHIDPTWNRTQIPVRGVPPPITNVPVNPTGEIDPETITDPVIRARYEQDLKTNREKVKNYNVQFALRRIEERAVDDLKLFAEARFTESSRYRREYEQIVNTSSLSDRRKKKFRKLVTPPLWPFD